MEEDAQPHVLSEERFAIRAVRSPADRPTGAMARALFR